MADNPVSQEGGTHAVASGVQNLLTCPPMLRHGFTYDSGSNTHRQQAAATSWIIQQKYILILLISNKILEAQPNRQQEIQIANGVKWMFHS